MYYSYNINPECSIDHIQVLCAEHGVRESET